MTAIYDDGTYLQHNPTWHQEHSPWKAAQIRRMLKQNSLRPQTVCEVGCGTGEILRQLARDLPQDTEFFGYDISPQAIDLCREKAGANLTFHQADLLQQDGQHFDLVMAIDVFEHVENCFDFLRKLRSKADYKIFHIPLDLSAQSVLRGTPLINLRRSVGHLHFYTKETALQTLRDTGYEIVDSFYTSGSLELGDRGWKANLLRIPRRFAFAASQDFAVRLFGGFALLVLAK